jgi:hypothetical protein
LFIICSWGGGGERERERERGRTGKSDYNTGLVTAIGRGGEGRRRKGVRTVLFYDKTNTNTHTKQGRDIDGIDSSPLFLKNSLSLSLSLSPSPSLPSPLPSSLLVSLSSLALIY